MANPNIVNVTTINGVTTSYAPTVTTAVGFINNAASSNTVYKIESLVAANTTSSAVSVTVVIYTGAAISAGSALTGGTGTYPICSTVSVPANSTLVVIEKSNGIYLNENSTIGVTTSSANNITFTVSYEAIS